MINSHLHRRSYNLESVDVIWLGSNPNVPESLDAILSPSSPSHYEGFVQQAKRQVAILLSDIQQAVWGTLNAHG